MLMTPRVRKLALTAHLTFSVGWLGAVAAFLVLAIAGVASQEAHTVRAAGFAMGLTVSCAIVPLAFASLLTGLVLALGTTWGLFRHYWVLIKFLLTAIATIVLLVQLKPISYLAAAAADPTSSVSMLREMSRRPLIHAAGGLVVLLLVQVLGVYKPWGMTRYGQRRQRVQGDAAAGGAMRWRYVFGIIVLAIIVLFIVLHLTGHAPRSH